MASMMQYIETAKDIERQGLKFYKNALKKVADPNSKGLLKLLVNEETEHLEYFTKLGAKYGKPPAKIKKLKSPLFKKAAYKKVGKKRAVTIDIFNTALEMEQKGIAFYKKMASRTKDVKLRKFLLGLAKMEQRHFKLIKEHQDSVYDAWYWEAMEMPALNT